MAAIGWGYNPHFSHGLSVGTAPTEMASMTTGLLALIGTIASALSTFSVVNTLLKLLVNLMLYLLSSTFTLLNLLDVRFKELLQILRIS